MPAAGGEGDDDCLFLARIQGHGIRVLDEACSEQLAEFAERGERIDPIAEFGAARELVWGRKIAVAGPTIRGDGDAANNGLGVAGRQSAAG